MDVQSTTTVTITPIPFQTVHVDGIVKTARCEYERYNIGKTIVQNICTDQEAIIPWGGVTWLMAIIGMVAALTLISIIIGACWTYIMDKGGGNAIDEINHIIDDDDDVTYVEDDDDDK